MAPGCGSCFPLLRLVGLVTNDLSFSVVTASVGTIKMTAASAMTASVVKLLSCIARLGGCCVLLGRLTGSRSSRVERSSKAVEVALAGREVGDGRGRSKLPF